MTFRIELRGVPEMDRKLRRLARRSPRAMGAALFEEAEGIMTKSKQIVPVDSGQLRASGFVDPPKIRRREQSVRMGYGTGYAVPVHEIPPPPQKSVGGRSARHRPPTQWKFLEKPFKAALRGMARRLGKSVWRGIRRGL